ncbi:MAG: baeRF7 domain-containing protein [Chloroflexota bacterium]
MVLSIDDVKTLVEHQSGLCASVFMPTHRKVAENREDPIRFKNLLRQAEEQLVEHGLRSTEARELLEPAYQLPLQSEQFWLHQGEGLAMFFTPEGFRHYRVPLSLPELVVVGDRCHIKPLLPLLTNDGSFYVLALSQNAVRLLRGTRYGVAEVPLEDVPAGLADALKYDDFEKQLQFHTGTQARGGERAAMYHGHGAGEEDFKNQILRYFRQVDEGLRELLRDERVPLILAGVDYLLPIYKEANKYPNLVEQGITGNPDELSPEELRDQAWQVVQPLFAAAQNEAATKFAQLSGSAQASRHLREIVPAAYHGRVESLFVPTEQHVWGTFNPDASSVHIHEENEPGDEDLLDLAALYTLLNGGAVYAVPPEEIPRKVLVAAVFRY